MSRLAGGVQEAVGEQAVLSPLYRQLARVLAGLFGLVGLVLFTAPGWAAPNFLWSVSPFVAMTIGAWYLGMAVLAWDIARVWRWRVIYAGAILLWLFSLLEAGVLVVHSARLRLDAPLGWPYLLIIAFAAGTSLLGIYEWARARPRLEERESNSPASLRISAALFVVAVALIAVFPLMGIGRGGTVFPEPLTVFTLNAFGAFYLSLAMGAIPLTRDHWIEPTVFYARSGMVLIGTITLAALVNIDKFDFAGRPGGMVYLGIYLVVAAVTSYFLWQHYRGASAARQTA